MYLLKNRIIRTLLLITIPGLLICSCHRGEQQDRDPKNDQGTDVVVRKREDGTISSVNEVDEMKMVHGVRVTYYSDGKTVYSQTTFEHGIKNGPSIRYYRNGQPFEHTGFRDGKKEGPTRKYYMNGDLMAELSYENGIIQPGLKEYRRDGSLVTEYPEIRFREVNHLKEKNRIDLQIYCEKKGIGVKYFRRIDTPGDQGRIYLISQNGETLLQFYVQKGEQLDEHIAIIAEIPTELGNVMVKQLTYHLSASNP